MADEKVDLSKISPRALDLLKKFAETSGAERIEKVVEDETFSLFELMKLIDTSRDPKIYPQDAVKVMETVRAVLAKFTRFGKPTVET